MFHEKIIFYYVSHPSIISSSSFLLYNTFS